MKQPAILVLGSVNMDLVVRGPKLPSPGETVLGGAFFQAHGGKGANQAVAAARLTDQCVGFIAAVGDDLYGRLSRQQLQRDNILTECVQTIDEPTGVAVILVDSSGENLISVASGANAHLSREHVQRIPQVWLDSAKVWLTNLESPIETVRSGLQVARENDLRTILNPAPVPSSVDDVLNLLPMVDVITPNASEALALAPGSHDAAESASRLAKYDCDVIVTLGSRGCLLCHQGQQTIVPAISVKAIDATAAGDAFNGALASQLAADTELISAIEFANQVAAISVTRAGAQLSLPTLVELQDFYR